jgi:hypothetical protein
MFPSVFAAIFTEVGTKASKTVSVKTEKSEQGISHDIRDHMALLHRRRLSEDPRAVKSQHIKTLRRLLKKLLSPILDY